MEDVRIQDDMLDDFESFNQWARNQSYAGVVNPADGVHYPDITTVIPEKVLEEIQSKVPEMKTIHYAFLRLTNENTEGAPHQAHNDSVMGQYTFLLYMQDGDGGTSLVRHKLYGMPHGPTDSLQESIWRRDTNTPEMWDVTRLIKMKSNRATWYPSEYMHRAEPIGGFGKSVHDGRLVLTIFFSGE